MDLENHGQGWGMNFSTRMAIWRSKDDRRELDPELVATKFFPILITVLACVIVLMCKNCILGIYHEFRKIQKKRNDAYQGAAKETYKSDLEYGHSSLVPLE